MITGHCCMGPGRWQHIVAGAKPFYLLARKQKRALYFSYLIPVHCLCWQWTALGASQYSWSTLMNWALSLPPLLSCEGLRVRDGGGAHYFFLWCFVDSLPCLTPAATFAADSGWLGWGHFSWISLSVRAGVQSWALGFLITFREEMDSPSFL